MIRVHTLVLGTCCAALLSVAACEAPAGDIESSTSLESDSAALRSLDAEEAEFVRLLNAHRASSGLPALVSTKLLNQVAYDHSLDMATNAYFSHTNLAGLSPFARMRNAGYQGGFMAENIAAGSQSAASTFEQWKNSAGHNTNMLGANYRAIGIGRAYVAGSPYRYYWTNVFGDRIDGSGDGATPIDPEEPEDPGEPACTGSAESEPNDQYTAPNAMAEAQCGTLATASDLDWFAWPVAQGVGYVVEATGDVRLDLWRFTNGRYTKAQNESDTRITGRTSAAGQWVLSVRSVNGSAGAYRVTRSP